jgi:hypothetical protein
MSEQPSENHHAEKKKAGPKTPKKSLRAALADNAPWMPPQYEIADVAAIQALGRGDADPDQQKRALRFMIETVCDTYNMAYRPGGEDGRRDTDFALGRAFPGQQLVKFLKLNVPLLRRSE